jgi:hypothetical protein
VDCLGVKESSGPHRHRQDGDVMTEPVTAGRMELVDDLEGLPGSSGGCLLALTLEVPVFLRVGAPNQLLRLGAPLTAGSHLVSQPYTWARARSALGLSFLKEWGRVNPSWSDCLRPVCADSRLGAGKRR